MLEKPDLDEAALFAGAERAFDLRLAALEFLPLGYDTRTAVYRLRSQDAEQYFLKLRFSGFERICVNLPHYLHAQGNRAIIDPLPARSRRRWASWGETTLILYPFIEEDGGPREELSVAQWESFGAALKAVHCARLPSWLKRQIRREDFAPPHPQRLREFQRMVETERFDEVVAKELAAFMRLQREQISRLAQRADELGAALQGRRLDFVLCHTDIHAANLLLARDGAVYIVDWDSPLLAPRERDLMFIGGPEEGGWYGAGSARLFYQGYGATQVDTQAVAYYRYARTVEDMAEFCAQLLLSDAGGADRAQSLEYFKRSFLPGHDVDIALRGDEAVAV
jgi:spectinomycin phosphotransferase